MCLCHVCVRVNWVCVVWCVWYRICVVCVWCDVGMCVVCVYVCVGCFLLCVFVGMLYLCVWCGVCVVCVSV